MILMTKCSECGIDKEAVWKDVQHLEKMIKMLMSVIDQDKQLNNWSSKLGEMVKKMNETVIEKVEEDKDA